MSQTVAQSQPNGIPTAEELGFDPAALREKYAAERAKRLRADANSQYQEITGQYAHYNADPYVEPGFTRPALARRARRGDHRRGLWRHVGGGSAARGRDHELSHHREGRGFWRDLVLEPLSRRPV